MHIVLRVDKQAVAQSLLLALRVASVAFLGRSIFNRVLRGRDFTHPRCARRAACASRLAPAFYRSSRTPPRAFRSSFVFCATNQVCAHQRLLREDGKSAGFGFLLSGVSRVYLLVCAMRVR